MDLKSKVSIVTGGNRGIGLAVVTALARAGSSVVISGRQQKRNLQVAEELERKFGIKTLALETDVAQEKDCERLIQETVAKLGTVHILVNNAGIGGHNVIAKTSTDDFDRILKTDLYGTFWCARSAYRQMQKNKGAPRGVIINASSLAGKQAWSGTGAYSASKFGVMALTQALADEGKAHDIKTIAVCPAMVTTPMTGVSGPEYLQPEDIAETVLYLLRLSPAVWPTEIVLELKEAA
jgi:3-oxoacyl-[acyl-carrier protein] reductase